MPALPEMPSSFGRFLSSTLQSAPTVSRMKPAFLSLTKRFFAKLQLSDFVASRPASTVATEAKELNYEAMDEEHRRLLQATSPLISSTDLP